MITSHSQTLSEFPPMGAAPFIRSIANLIDSIERAESEKSESSSTSDYSASAETSRRIAAEHNAEQRRKILVILEPGDLSGPKIAQRMGYCGTSSINRHMKEMLRLDMVRKIGIGKGMKWGISALD